MGPSGPRPGVDDDGGGAVEEIHHLLGAEGRRRQAPARGTPLPPVETPLTGERIKRGDEGKRRRGLRSGGRWGQKLRETVRVLSASLSFEGSIRRL